MNKQFSLQSFFEKNLEKYADLLLYLNAVKFCRNAPESSRGMLYYALLNWKDCHPELQRQCIELSKAYKVEWIEKDKCIEKDNCSTKNTRYFYAIESETYQKDAREFYNNLSNSENIGYVSLTPIFIGELAPYFEYIVTGEFRECKNGNLVSIENIKHYEVFKNENH